jgi:hypothetical protein
VRERPLTRTPSSVPGPQALKKDGVADLDDDAEWVVGDLSRL